MNFYFWQNVISIHQSAFITALSQHHDVVLVVEKDIDESRKAVGWSVPSMGNAEIVVHPDSQHIDKLLSMPDVQHVFSGIDAFPFLYDIFKLAVKRKVRISVMMEPFNAQGVKGVFRRIKYAVLMARYAGYISNLFITGTNGIDCYRKVGAPKDKLRQWGYFTKCPEYSGEDKTVSAKPKIIFVGQLIDRKNIAGLLDIYPEIEALVDTFTIVGQGILADVVREKASAYRNITFKGAVDNKGVQSLIRENDYLILPSKFDGWGAVVNEALLNGTRVLCSDRVGAKVLLDGDMRGESFPLERQKMTEVITKWLKKGTLTIEQREGIKNWAKRHISGEAAATYFVKVIEGTDVKAPWL